MPLTVFKRQSGNIDILVLKGRGSVQQATRILKAEVLILAKRSERTMIVLDLGQFDFEPTGILDLDIMFTSLTECGIQLKLSCLTRRMDELVRRYLSPLNLETFKTQNDAVRSFS